MSVPVQVRPRVLYTAFLGYELQNRLEVQSPMTEVKSKERRPRKLQQIVETEKVQYLIKNYLLGKTYYLKHDIQRETINIIAHKGEQYVEITTKRALKHHTIFYRIFKKYIEVSCTVVKKTAPNTYILEVKTFKVAQHGREQPRKLIVDDNQVTINNIRAARNIINTSLFNVPTSVKVHFAQYKHQIMSMADEVQIDIFDRQDPLLELVRKSSKTLYIRDTQEIASYLPVDEKDFVDYRFYLNTRMEDQMAKYRRDKIVSEVIVPIIYIDHANEPISLGYFRLRSKKKPIGMDVVIQLKILSFEMVDKIRDSNTMLIDKKQKITNISYSGLLLRVDDPELKRFLIHQGGFSFDIIFKLQQPITVFTQIIHTTEISNRPLLIGVYIFGHSSRKGEKIRYSQLLNDLT